MKTLVWTKSQLKIVSTGARKGLTTKQVAEKIGMSFSATYAKEKELGIKRSRQDAAILRSLNGTAGNQHGPIKRNSTFQKKVTLAYMKYGLSYNELARKFKCDETVIHRIAKDNGWSYTSLNADYSFPWTLELEKKAKRLSDKYDYATAAKRLRCSVFELVYMLVENGWQKHNLPEYADRKKRLLTCHNKQAIVADFNSGNGMTYKELELKYRIPFTMVRKTLADANVYLTRDKMCSLVRSVKVDEDICKRYVSGETLTDIAKHYGTNPTSIQRVLIDFGIDRRNGSKKYLMKLLAQGKINLHDWFSYADIVRRLTEHSYRKHKKLIDPENKRGTEFHLDHRLSIYEAFCKHAPPINPKLIAHPMNLKILPARKNIRKSVTSSLSLGRLERKIKRFKQSRGN